MVTKVLCECTGCSARRIVLPGEIEQNDQPMCECGMPMVAVAAQAVEDEVND